jgi:two-component system phosphate regulon sensor histidine kinase PhoR
MDIKSPSQLSEIEELRQKLEEANDTLEAIRGGQVDAFVIKDRNGPRIYTLKSADQTYRVLIEKMIEGAVTLNKKGVILYSNSRFASMLKMPLSTIIGSYFKDYITPEHAGAFDVLLNNAWKEECKEETCLTRADGHEIAVLVSLTILELDEGTALSLILTDLTPQKKIEKELREKNQLLEAARLHVETLNNELELKVNKRTSELLTSREHFKFLADSIPVIVWTALPDGKYNYFNRQWYEYTGLTFEESKGDGWQRAIHPDDLPSTLAAWEVSLKTGLPFKTEDRKRSSTGKYNWHLVHALPFKDKNDKIIAWFGVCTDIEEQKKDMHKKDEFISMASHELKTPVTSLSAYTQILMMGMESKENTMEFDMLVKMNAQINKLVRLIGDLLDVSKANLGYLNFNYEKTDFNELVKEVANAMQLTSRHKIELQLCETEVINCDKNRLGQVITNLVSNAVKYSPNADKVIITSEKNKNSIKLSVQDFGIGIPVSQHSKLFSRFFRVTENTFPGLGLGLYISNEIIKRHSGTMGFKSEEGKGSVFYFILPLKDVFKTANDPGGVI